MRLATLPLLLTIALPVAAQDWSQWGRDARHHGNTDAAGQRLDRIDAEHVLDPFADQEKAASQGTLLVHYQAPLVDGDDVFVVVKSGSYTGAATRNTQVWNVRNLRWAGGQLTTRWTRPSDWKPVPPGGPAFEQVYHCALTADAIWAPAAGGTIEKLSREDGSLIARFHPFGTSIDTSIVVTSPPTADRAGNIYYTAIQFASSGPWMNDPANSWLVRIGADGSTSTATFASLTPSAPAATEQCLSVFAANQSPFPPSPTAVPPSVHCGPQRPGLNAAPAVADDGTIYVVSRAHGTDRWSYLVAVNTDLTPRWQASMRGRFHDGCDVLLPPSGTVGGCRAGANLGVDPGDNLPGSGRVNDNSTSSPVVTPDGSILYGAYTSYNFGEGHLMKFASDGSYFGAHRFGWDLTPSIWPHGDTYSIVLKENHYVLGFVDRWTILPNDPEAYYITQLSASLEVEWKYRSTETRSCARAADGSMQCTDDHPNGFEWCVNAVAVDRRGVVYANSEDGHLYAIEQGGQAVSRTFLRLALGAAYTPLSIGADGRIYTQNDGRLFVVGGGVARRRALR
jgi:outer membrane protein assembly factor BamB